MRRKPRECGFPPDHLIIARERIDDAAKYLALPQCGFASTEDGNTLTEDQKWAKLKLRVDVARDIRGGV